jgi:enoyl-CoA hydratase
MATEQPYQHILYEVERGRARITLNQPKKRNPLTAGLLEELVDALWEADDDRSVHCVILRAEGPAFCAGYDLAPAPVDHEDGVDRRTGRGIDVLRRIRPGPLPPEASRRWSETPNRTLDRR